MNKYKLISLNDSSKEAITTFYANDVLQATKIGAELKQLPVEKFISIYTLEKVN